MATYSARAVQANIKRQIGMQIAPTCPGNKRASGLQESPSSAAAGSKESRSQSRYATTDIMAPTRMPKNATEVMSINVNESEINTYVIAGEKKSGICPQRLSKVVSGSVLSDSSSS